MTLIIGGMAKCSRCGCDVPYIGRRVFGYLREKELLCFGCAAKDCVKQPSTTLAESAVDCDHWNGTECCNGYPSMCQKKYICLEVAASATSGTADGRR